MVGSGKGDVSRYLDNGVPTDCVVPKPVAKCDSDEIERTQKCNGWQTMKDGIFKQALCREFVCFLPKILCKWILCPTGEHSPKLVL